jgi:hypothetical protein
MKRNRKNTTATSEVATTNPTETTNTGIPTTADCPKCHKHVLACRCEQTAISHIPGIGTVEIGDATIPEEKPKAAKPKATKVSAPVLTETPQVPLTPQQIAADFATWVTTAKTTKAAKLAKVAKPATEKKEKKEVEVRECLCGCGGTTKSQFCMGHDAKAKGMLRRVIDGKADANTLPEALLRELPNLKFVRHCIPEALRLAIS